ncbi:hypothetical protein FA15DRAFT_679338 [Coprinopsis marcescibilis]|uniref:DDE-1 domain-containing protein n=1 Tax=Coprinopsis marcescibilis TaxID=230819 RepID=A0A5C3L210_COPMA|nr:hypothetical protein FA15DRAFT_679338 [Coprinopsis marcescibilis]
MNVERALEDNALGFLAMPFSMNLTPRTLGAAIALEVVEMKEMEMEISIRDVQRDQLAGALTDLKKLLKLQAKQTCAMHTYLQLVVQKGQLEVDASEQAVESHGFAAIWGGRNICTWTKVYLERRELPTSQQGRHGKVFSLLQDPQICTELCAFIRSHKWSMNPEKLVQFTEGKEMPEGLTRYIEIQLFPRIQLSVRKGISLTTAWHWLHIQAHDATTKSWVFEDQHQHQLRKKGVGQGLHQSDVICLTVGWLEEASQTLEYGKNYDGYWNGELFVKQLCEQIIPAFEKAHGPKYQALIMVDNLQGHSVYAEDALVVSHMNTNERVTQKMVFLSNHPEFPDQPKGIRQCYLQECCDFTFDTLKANMQDALTSVNIDTIRRWEHCMAWWMHAYQSGLLTQVAQAQVKQFSSAKYHSHCHVPETVACTFDV